MNTKSITDPTSEAGAPRGSSTSHPAETHSTPALAWLASGVRCAAGACLRSLGRPEAGTLVFALVWLAIVYRKTAEGQRKKKKKEEEPAAARPLLQRSVSMAVLHGGRSVMERIIDAQEARLQGDQGAGDAALNEMRRLLSEPRTSFSELSRNAAKLEMMGKEEEAVKELQEAVRKAEREGKPHEVYELQMVLVEMLIYEGEYQQALGCKCLKEREISDARAPLYQAIIYMIMGNKEQAKVCYKEFQEIRTRFHLGGSNSFKEGSRLFYAMYDIEEFEKIVDNLKKEIEHANSLKPKV